MNDILSHEHRAMFLHAYDEYDKKVSAMMKRAICEVDGNYMRGESFDLLPLCVATLLYCAGGVSFILLKEVVRRLTYDYSGMYEGTSRHR
jgi:hypothetical protein